VRQSDEEWSESNAPEQVAIMTQESIFSTLFSQRDDSLVAKDRRNAEKVDFS